MQQPGGSAAAGATNGVAAEGGEEEEQEEEEVGLLVANTHVSTLGFSVVVDGAGHASVRGTRQGRPV